MKTHNLVIYHCLACGSVLHCEPDQDAPHCCNSVMTRAAAETIEAEEGPLPQSEKPPPAAAVVDRAK